MPQYRRMRVPGGTYFLTLVTYQRQPLFAEEENVAKLRRAICPLGSHFVIATTKKEKPFNLIGAVVLPDHLHFIWTLPPNDANYSLRVSRLKVLFTRSLENYQSLPKKISYSRQKHREKYVWQRRFWEHTIRNETDLAHHLDYIHYNPVKHRLVSCPHLWQYSSFRRSVEAGLYTLD